MFPVDASGLKLFWGNSFIKISATLLILASQAGCRADAPVSPAVRAPAVAGSFYPGDRAELSALVAEDLRVPPAELPPHARLIALLVPHAGYVFSGKVAGAGLSLLSRLDLETVVVVGTGHRATLPGALAWSGQAFRTPLGDYPVDDAAVKSLAAGCADVKVEPVSWEQEHSVEVEVPFLQQVAPRARLVPLIMSQADPEQIQRVGLALAHQAEGSRTVLVVSSDMSHYPSGADAERVDRSMLQSILTMDPDQVAKADAAWMSRGVPELACTLCGLQALETVLVAARALGADRAQVLAYSHSGKISGDNTRTVGYAAVAFFTLAPAGDRPSAPPAAAENWSPEQRRALLNLAQTTIAQAVGSNGLPPARPDPDWMQVKRAVFVTLKQNRELRGCIGMTEAQLTLGNAVRQMARAAALEDPRFPPLSAAELGRTSLEISILSPLRRIQGAGEIRMGEHGVLVKANGHSGLFLPQVAQETGWSREEFLNELCSQKANLPAGAWKDPGTELYVFTVQAFGRGAE